MFWYGSCLWGSRFTQLLNMAARRHYRRTSCYLAIVWLTNLSHDTVPMFLVFDCLNHESTGHRLSMTHQYLFTQLAHVTYDRSICLRPPKSKADDDVRVCGKRIAVTESTA